MIVCLNNATIGAASLEGFLEAASVSGFQAVEIGLEAARAYADQTSIAGLKNLFVERDLIVGSGGLPVDWRGPEDTFAAEMEVLPQWIDLCRTLDISRLCTWIPPRWDMPYADVFALARDRLGAVADLLSSGDIRLGLEFVAPQGNFAGCQYKFVTTLAELLDLIEAMGRDNVGVLLDSYHAYVGETSVSELTALDPSLIVQVHLNDAYPGVPRQELEDLKRLLPGEGAIPLLPMLRALERIGYDWTVSVETFNEELKALGPVSAAKRAKSALDGLLAMLC